jgi:hypothetical protein
MHIFGPSLLHRSLELKDIDFSSNHQSLSTRVLGRRFVVSFNPRPTNYHRYTRYIIRLGLRVSSHWSVSTRFAKIQNLLIWFNQFSEYSNRFSPVQNISSPVKPDSSNFHPIFNPVQNQYKPSNGFQAKVADVQVTTIIIVVGQRS